MKRFLRNNGLSVVLAILFLVFITGQILTGWHHTNSENRLHHWPEESLSAYLTSGACGEAIFENWESEFLQMALYVILTAYLFQKGSAESKDPDKKEEVDEDAEKHRRRAEVPAPVRKGGVALALYNHSLFLAFLILFILSFSGHAYFGWQAVNGECMQHGQPAETLGSYITSAQFWFESFQNWQSEFLAILSIVLLSIWLREKGSPESKPVFAPHSQTGE